MAAVATPLQAVADGLAAWCSFETLPSTVQVRKFSRVVSVTALDGVRAAIDDVVRLCDESGYSALGYLSYEAAAAFEPAMRVSAEPQCSDFPLLWFGLYTDADTCSGTGGAPAPPDDEPPSSPRFQIGAWQADVARGEYDAAVQAVRASIKDGDMYQANYTLCMSAHFEGDASALASRLVQAQRCGFGAYLDTGAFAIASASPELFFHWDRSTGEISTRPMKGTRRRGLSSVDDVAEAAALSSSVKDQAENLMIVDLLRNDIGRVSVPGSVKVTDLFKIERYPTVLQMTSTVSARTVPGTTLQDVLTALFPCGSVTGAPKISAMRGIAGLEKQQRHVYCGAILHISPGPAGRVTASVPIRTVIVDTSRGCAHYGVGGGITWDSTPGGEYDEVLAKAAVLHSAMAAETACAPCVPPASLHPSQAHPGFRLLETLRWTGGPSAGAGEAGLEGYHHLRGHLDRLSASASYFCFQKFDEGAVKSALRGVVASAATGDLRVRLLVDAHGGVEVQSAPFVGPPPGRSPWEEGGACHATPVPSPVVCVVAGSATPPAGALLYHKTTQRGTYEDARARWLHPSPPDGLLPFDVLLWNEEGFVQEFTIGNVVMELPVEEDEVGGGRGTAYELVTPPVAAGLLPGVLRSAILATGRVVERDIPVSSLPFATRVWCVNSVRGWVPVATPLRQG